MKHYYKKYIVLVAVWMCAIIGTAQELKVVSFEKLLTDVTARSTAVKDGNGDVCALIKVSLPVPNCEFDGNIVGKPEFRISEYWVYMTPSSKKLVIRCPGRESLKADFDTGVESAVTYQLRLSGYPDIAGSNVTADPGANYLILDITPKTGLSVKVDGQLQSVDNGQVMSYLKYGTHRYVVEAEGYASKEGTATISRGEKTIVNITLESVMSTLSIRPTTSGATIKINGQTKGTGNWQGQLTPGIYRVDVEKNGYRSYSETVELAQRDNKSVSIPALTPIYGVLNIGYKPIGSSIAIDGKTVGTTPSVISDLLIGKHSITISKEGYAPFNTSVDIAEGETTQLAGSLQASQTNVSAPSTTGISSGIINGHEYVELGLPSGLKWATCNVGASSPSDYGDYYAWGETTTKSEYTESTSMTYNKNIGDISGNPDYDAARANWGGSWRLPSTKEYEELKEKCKWTWTSQGDHNGYKVTGPNGKSIFLPAAGWRLGVSLGSAEGGYYWSSTPFESHTQGAYYLFFGSGDHFVSWSNRDDGLSVRPVSD